MGWILFFSIGIPLLCLPAYILIEMTKPKEERWGVSAKSSSEGSGSGSMKNPPIRPSAFVGLETTQHPADPRTLKPVQGLTEYVPDIQRCLLPAEHQLDLVTDGRRRQHQPAAQTCITANWCWKRPNGLLPNRSSGQVYKLGIYTGSIRGSAYYEEAVLNADTRPLAKAELVREPGNKYDKNAVAIHASGAGCVGYVNKQNAARLSKHLGVGEEYMAIFTSGCKRGDDSVPVSVLIAPTANHDVDIPQQRDTFTK